MGTLLGILLLSKILCMIFKMATKMLVCFPHIGTENIPIQLDRDLSVPQTQVLLLNLNVVIAVGCLEVIRSHIYQ